ncbi:hypothetical protein KSF_021760 [Reticulibacter mediterranei]|uniref:Uncharacterized protein n=1 Tax=Reticulibacter mediterranei TaxID=2778369 RepID=A0A8J3IGH9_9CHLR|nr:hypothetical protein KSF_021760 [Reticulibacter mediterranei]
MRITIPFVVCFVADAIANEPPGLIMQSEKKIMYSHIYRFGRTGVSIFKIVYSGSNITTNHYQFMGTKLPVYDQLKMSTSGRTQTGE